VSTSWVAGTVRAKALTRRRLGAAGARALATNPDLSAAATTLAATPYGHDAAAGTDLAALQHAVGATLLWHLRVLAGWLPRDGADVLRLLAAGFEVANLDEQLYRLGGRAGDPAYRLGSLETAWARLQDTSSLDEVRRVLDSSAWGDPGSSTPRAISVAIRLAWADRVAAGVPEAAAWARAGAALLLLRESRTEGLALDETLTLRASSVLGAGFVSALSRGEALGRLSALLPGDTRWALDEVRETEDLWHAEAAWHGHVERDGFALLHGSGFGRGPVVGAAAVLAVDAWRVRAALETAARGGAGAALEAFDAVA
jgi:hypothetical protein